MNRTPVMPTAARLVAAIALGAVSAGMALVFVGYYPEEPWARNPTRLLQTFGVIGALVGWYSLGKRVAAEESTGIGLGIRATLTTAFWVLTVVSIWKVITRIIDDKLRGAEPMAAVLEVFQRAAEYFAFAVNWQIIAIAMFGGICVGVLTRNVHHTWR